jgi:hypothetical protein
MKNVVYMYMSEKDSLLSIIMGILALIVVIYRLLYIGYPMFEEGFNEKNPSKMLKSLTLLV